MSAPAFTLRPYVPADETAALELWQRSWQVAYPRLDFAARLAWWRERWQRELVPCAVIMIAAREDMLGFVTVDAKTGYLDQLVVAPEAWGSGVAAALLDEAKRIAPLGLDLHVNQDNFRAIRFYQKHGFVITGAGINPHSLAPVHKMSWRAGSRPSNCSRASRA